MTEKIRLNRAGMAEMLKSPEVAARIHELAAMVAVSVTTHPAYAKRPDAEVKVEHYTTDRAAAAVVVKHPGALGIEAKYGPLQKGAKAARLQTKMRRSK